MEQEVNLLKLRIKELKSHSKEVQKSLAEKVIKLEETIDFLKETHEEKLNLAEASYKQEVEMIQTGVNQREKQMLNLIEQLQERNMHLEMTNNQAKDEDALLTKSMQKRSSQQIMSRLNSRLSGIGSRQSVHTLIAEIENDT